MKQTNVRLTRKYFYEADDGITFQLKFSHKQANTRNFSGKWEFSKGEFLPQEEFYQLITSDGRVVQNVKEDEVREAFRELGYILTR
jgi:hypothetical protein